jgi:hypothetical protein
LTIKSGKPVTHPRQTVGISTFLGFGGNNFIVNHLRLDFFEKDLNTIYSIGTLKNGVKILYIVPTYELVITNKKIPSKIKNILYFSIAI